MPQPEPEPTPGDASPTAAAASATAGGGDSGAGGEKGGLHAEPVRCWAGTTVFLDPEVGAFSLLWLQTDGEQCSEVVIA